MLQRKGSVLIAPKIISCQDASKDWHHAFGILPSSFSFPLQFLSWWAKKKKNARWLQVALSYMLVGKFCTHKKNECSSSHLFNIKEVSQKLQRVPLLSRVLRIQYWAIHDTKGSLSKMVQIGQQSPSTSASFCECYICHMASTEDRSWLS